MTIEYGANLRAKRRVSVQAHRCWTRVDKRLAAGLSELGASVEFPSIRLAVCFALAPAESKIVVIWGSEAQMNSMDPMRSISNHDREHHQRKWHHVTRRVFHLVVLAVLSDIAVFVVELIAGMDPIADIQQSPILYLYLLVGTVVAFALFGYVLGTREALLEENAIKDPLTGLYNSRFFYERQEQALAAAQRHQLPLSLVLLDVDHFKAINDTFGHPIGDRVLRSIGHAIGADLRAGEIGARVGGEEFAIVLPNTPAKTAAVAAERIRQAARQEVEQPGKRSNGAVSLSAGVACFDPENPMDPVALFSRADAALYRAKENGRDRVCVAEQAAVVSRVQPVSDGPSLRPAAKGATVGHRSGGGAACAR